MNKIDRYIIKKFLGTFFYALILLLLVVIVIDISEKISERSKNLFFGNTNFQRGFGANCSKYARAKRKKPIYSYFNTGFILLNSGS